MKLRLQALTRVSAASLATVFFVSNCALVHATQSNIWSERRNRAQIPQLASLPANLTNSAQILDQMPAPVTQTLSSAVSQQIQRQIPKNQEARVAPLLQALSSNFGTVRKIAMPGHSAPKIIVHIQDVHLNAEAQENIGKTVQGLLADKTIDMIGLEGAFAPIELAAVRAYEDKKATEIVANYLLHENRISGAVHAAYVSPNDVAVVGVDDKKHYDVNVSAYKNTLTKKEADVRELRSLSAKVNQSRPQLNSALATFHAEANAYEKGDLALGDYIPVLAKHVPDHATSVDVFLEAYKLERSLNFSQVEKERTAFLSQLIPQLNRGETDQLLSTSIAFRLGKINQSDFYSYLKNLCREKQFALSKYKAMDTYIRYVLLSDGIRAEKLFQDITAMEKAAYAALARTAAEQAWVAETKQLSLIAKLLEFSLTPDEWLNYKEGPSVQVPFDLAAYESFYQEAEARNQAIADNLLRAMDNAQAKTAVLVTGGFHSPGIDALLEKAGVATLTFSPKITKVDAESGSQYLSFFSQEKTPLDQIFSGEKLFVSPNPHNIAPNVTGVLQRAASQKLSNPNGPDSITMRGDSGELTVKFADGPTIGDVEYSSARFDAMGRVVRFVRGIVKSWTTQSDTPSLDDVRSNSSSLLRIPGRVMRIMGSIFSDGPIPGEEAREWGFRNDFELARGLTQLRNDLFPPQKRLTPGEMRFRSELANLFTADRNSNLEILIVGTKEGSAPLGGNQMLRYYDDTATIPHAVIAIDFNFYRATLGAVHSSEASQRASDRIFLERLLHELAHSNDALSVQGEIDEELRVLREIDWNLWMLGQGDDYPGLNDFLKNGFAGNVHHVTGRWKYGEFRRIRDSLKLITTSAQQELAVQNALRIMAMRVVGKNPKAGVKAWGAPAQTAGQAFTAWRKGRADEIFAAFDEKTAPLRISHYEAVRDLDKGILKLDGVDSKTKKLIIVKDNKTAPMPTREAYEKYINETRVTEKGPVAIHGSKDFVEITLEEALRDEEAGFLVFDEKNNSGKFYLDPIASTKKRLDRDERQAVMKRFLEKVIKGAKARGTPTQKIFSIVHPFQASPFTSIRADHALALYEAGLIAPRNLTEDQYVKSRTNTENLFAMADWESVPYYESPFQKLGLEFVPTSMSAAQFLAHVEKMQAEYFGTTTIMQMGVPAFNVLGKWKPSETTLSPSQQMFRREVIQSDILAGHLRPLYAKDGSLDGVVLTNMTINDYYAYRERQGKMDLAMKGLSDVQKKSDPVQIFTSDKKMVQIPASEAWILFQNKSIFLNEKDPKKPGQDIVLQSDQPEAALVNMINREKMNRKILERPDDRVKVGGAVEMTLTELRTALTENAVVVDPKGAPAFAPNIKPADYQKTVAERRLRLEFEKKLDGKDPIYLVNQTGSGQNFPSEDIKRAYQDQKVVFDATAKKLIFAPGVTGPAFAEYLSFIRAERALALKTAEMEAANAKKFKDGYGDQRTYFSAIGFSGNSFVSGAMVMRSFDEVRKGFRDGRFGYDPKSKPEELKALTTKADYQKHLDALKSGKTLNTLIGNNGVLGYFLTYTGAKYIYEYSTAAWARLVGFVVQGVQVSPTRGQVSVNESSFGLALSGPMASFVVAVLASTLGGYLAFSDVDPVLKAVMLSLIGTFAVIPNLILAMNLLLVNTPGSRGFQIFHSERQKQLESLAETFAAALESNQSGRLSAEALAQIQNLPFSLNDLKARPSSDGLALTNSEKSYVERRAGEILGSRTAGAALIASPRSFFAALVNIVNRLGEGWLGQNADLEASRGAALTFGEEQSLGEQVDELTKIVGVRRGIVIALISSDQRRDELARALEGQQNLRFFSPRDGYVPGGAYDLNAILNFAISKLDKNVINNTTFATPDGDFQSDWIGDVGVLETLTSQGYDIRIQQRSVLLGAIPTASLNISNILEMMSHIAKFA